MSRFTLCNCPAGFAAAPECHAPDCPGYSGAGKTGRMSHERFQALMGNRPAKTRSLAEAEATIAQQAARIAELMADQISYEQRIDELENRLSNRAMEHAQDLGALIEAQAECDQLRAELEQQRGVVVLPERNELRADSDIEDAWQRGWNACLDGVSRLNPPGELQKRVENALIYGTSHPEIYDLPSSPRKFRLRDPVRKTKGSQWSGRVVGFYSTEQTPDGYAVESFTEKGSVQIYPGSALEPCEEPGECVAVPDGCKFELGFDVLDKPFRFVDSKSHVPTIKIILPACAPEDMEAFDVRDKIAKSVCALLAQQGKAVGDE